MSIGRKKKSALAPFHASQYWVRTIDCLINNWALAQKAYDQTTVLFINDRSEVFDRMQFQSEQEANEGLEMNGFRRIDGTDDSFFLDIPHPPYADGVFHMPGPVYSSGEYWRTR